MFAPSDAVRSITLTRRCAIKCNALNLSRYWKTGLSAESQPHHACRVLGLDCLPANGSLSRAAKTVIGDTIWTPNMGEVREPCSDFSIP